MKKKQKKIINNDSSNNKKNFRKYIKLLKKYDSLKDFLSKITTQYDLSDINTDTLDEIRKCLNNKNWELEKQKFSPKKDKPKK